MAHNGKTSLTEYDLTVMHDWEIEKVKKAVEKRKRRDKREKEERKAKKVVAPILTDGDFPEIKGSHPGDAHNYG